ncbi:MAG: ERCC4 domain-containing protein [Candidatus Nanoarchaeia archaeon]|nr:hypothetical protein [Candidatus Haiyanarchaeum thermophilum]MCW1303377.1 hypothetical protein [Candidatus Haiyanarchaeum thermophilum]MCW1303936.1 hypothetical protein [Candidatus Haiyanarchaeum thermophilum]MCW1306739.1 hypothetical protein [Candidatus Haiyanarchaeum thermophilum]MCW1308184.1 hypothetical protein [Candidatus Haiyanarchaeum thermophilum]
MRLERQRLLEGEELRILVDVREDEEIKAKLRELGARLIEKSLDVGDFIVSEEVCIERKSWEDFLRSIWDKRLFSQVEKMKASFERGVIIIEGERKVQHFNRNALLGALAFLIAKDISLIFTQDKMETARLIFEIAKRKMLGGNISFVRIKRQHGEKGEKEFVLSAFPGIGMKTARKLVERFGSLSKIFSASVSELRKAGMKKSIAIKFKKFLESE